MDQERLKRVDSVLEEAVRTGEVAGCNALVLKDGKEVYYGQSGWADKDFSACRSRWSSRICWA